MKQTILLVEDDKAIREIYQLKFKFSGLDIDVAKDGLEAIRIIKEKKPSIVLLDISIPKKNGFEVLKEIKSINDVEIQAIKFIMLTNLSNEQDILEAKRLGAIDYFIKAKIKPKEIVERVKSILEGTNKK